MRGTRKLHWSRRLNSYSKEQRIAGDDDFSPLFAAICVALAATAILIALDDLNYFRGPSIRSATAAPAATEPTHDSALRRTQSARQP